MEGKGQNSVEVSELVDYKMVPVLGQDHSSRSCFSVLVFGLFFGNIFPFPFVMYFAISSLKKIHQILRF